MKTVGEGRVERTGDCRDWTPEEALTFVLSNLHPDTTGVLIVEYGNDGVRQRIDPTYCGMTAPQLVYLLNAVLHGNILADLAEGVLIGAEDS
jgi:hypothetical protein